MNTNDPARVDYWKSLLKIEVSMAVLLAQRTMPVDRILQITPGMMLQFDKNCETPMSVEVDGHPIANCEVVKVGDRFGVKLLEVLDRPEHWIPLIK
jgi:flagellar motor switch protein FliN/FliY